MAIPPVDDFIMQMVFTLPPGSTPIDRKTVYWKEGGRNIITRYLDSNGIIRASLINMGIHTSGQPHEATIDGARIKIITPFTLDRIETTDLDLSSRFASESTSFSKIDIIPTSTSTSASTGQTDTSIEKSHRLAQQKLAPRSSTTHTASLPAYRPPLPPSLDLPHSSSSSLTTSPSESLPEYLFGFEGGPGCCMLIGGSYPVTANQFDGKAIFQYRGQRYELSTPLSGRYLVSEGYKIDQLYVIDPKGGTFILNPKPKKEQNDQKHISGASSSRVSKSHSLVGDKLSGVKESSAASLTKPLDPYFFEKDKTGIHAVKPITDPHFRTLGTMGDSLILEYFGIEYALSILQEGTYALKCDPTTKKMLAILPDKSRIFLKPSS